MNEHTKKLFEQPDQIGFYQFPEKENGNIYIESSYNLKCIRFPVTVNVKLIDVTFGENNEYSCRAVVTSKVDIAKRLPLDGFGPMAFIDEAQTMKEAAKLFCEQHQVELCHVVNNWPFFKGIVSSVK